MKDKYIIKLSYIYNKLIILDLNFLNLYTVLKKSDKIK